MLYMCIKYGKTRETKPEDTDLEIYCKELAYIVLRLDSATPVSLGQALRKGGLKLLGVKNCYPWVKFPPHQGSLNSAF